MMNALPIHRATTAAAAIAELRKAMTISLIEFFILRLLRETVKNPQRKAELRERLLSIRDAIDAAYQDEK
jgi:hypothetical protein